LQFDTLLSSAGSDESKVHREIDAAPLALQGENMQHTTMRTTSQSTAPLMNRPTLYEKCLGIAWAGVILAALASCSGAVSSPPDPITAVPLSVSPPTADIFSGIPTTFTISGGTPGYSAFSSNSVASITVTDNTFTVMAAKVTSDTAIDITVRDSANAIPVTVKTNIKPTIFSVLPSSPITIAGARGVLVGQDGSCPSATLPIKVDFYIFGGMAPYSVISPLTTFAQISPVNGGRFTATIMDCGKTSFIVTDKAGNSLETSTVEGIKGAQGSALPSTAFSVVPNIVSIACGSGASVLLAGTGTFSVTSPDTSNGNFIVTPTSGMLPANVSVGVSSGTVGTIRSPVAVDFLNNGVKLSALVTITGLVGGACP